MSLSPKLQWEEASHPAGKIVRFKGEADFQAVPSVRLLLKRLLDECIPQLIVDLSGVTFLNTPFWAALQRYQLEGHPGSKLAICGMNEALRAAYEINGVGSMEGESGNIIVFETLDAMLTAKPGFPAAMSVA